MGNCGRLTRASRASGDAMTASRNRAEIASVTVFFILYIVVVDASQLEKWDPVFRRDSSQSSNSIYTFSRTFKVLSPFLASPYSTCDISLK